jgi:ribosomal protein S1
MIRNISSDSRNIYGDTLIRKSRIVGNMLGAEIDFIIKGIDSPTRSIVASRIEAMSKKRQTFYETADKNGKCKVYEGRTVQARVIAVAQNAVRVEVFGVECSILSRDLS